MARGPPKRCVLFFPQCFCYVFSTVFCFCSTRAVALLAQTPSLILTMDMGAFAGEEVLGCSHVVLQNTEEQMVPDLPGYMPSFRVTSVCSIGLLDTFRYCTICQDPLHAVRGSRMVPPSLLP